MFTIKIKTQNEAFSDGNRDEEIARILERVAERVKEGEMDGFCVDINGNKVGSFGF